LFIIIPTQERHKALEEMGISIQSSGIAVEKNKFYLVNLNADPSLNELLVYYLKVSDRAQLTIALIKLDAFRLIWPEN
jgi:kinesin family protein 13